MDYHSVSISLSNQCACNMLSINDINVFIIHKFARNFYFHQDLTIFKGLHSVSITILHSKCCNLVLSSSTLRKFACISSSKINVQLIWLCNVISFLIKLYFAEKSYKLSTLSKTLLYFGVIVKSL